MHLPVAVKSSLILFRLCKYIETMAFNGQSKNVHILAGIFPLDILYLEGKSPLLMWHNNVKSGDMLPSTSKSSAFWDVGVDSHLKWLLLFSPDEAGESGRHLSDA